MAPKTQDLLLHLGSRHCLAILLVLPYSGVSPTLHNMHFKSPLLFPKLLTQTPPLDKGPRSLSFAMRKGFHGIPGASWSQIYHHTTIYRHSSILPSWCLRLIQLLCPGFQPFLLLRNSSPLSSTSPSSLMSKEEVNTQVSSILQTRATKDLSDPILPTSYCPPHSPLPLCLHLLFPPPSFPSVPHSPWQTRFISHHVIQMVLKF